jgi:hypothetical protein
VRLAGWSRALVFWGVSCDRQILVGEDSPPDAGLSASDSAAEVVAPDSPSIDRVDLDAGPDLDATIDLDATTGVDAPSGPGDDSGLVPLAVPWSTGFESAPGDSWVPGNPECYTTGGATFQLVTTPVHSGQHAGAFSVNTALASPSQTRCLKQGALPTAAYYGAWYYVPAPAVNSGNWNLLHFQGANVADGASAHGLWDVSLANAANGSLQAVVYDFLRMRLLQTTGTVPTGAWVHFEVYLRRAADSTGQFTLRLDGQVILDLTGLATDDSLWGQWFVGNFATALSPPASTLYVDDVAIGLVSAGP